MVVNQLLKMTPFQRPKLPPIGLGYGLILPRVDAGDPIQLFCWAIILFRMAEQDNGGYKLAESMLSNLYIIPYTTAGIDI